MLRGSKVHLRPIREADLPDLYTALSDLETRGDYFPLGVPSETRLRSQFGQNGFWSDDEGMLLITDLSGAMVGEIEFFPITTYLHGYEISYQLFGSGHAGRGDTTEAVNLLVGYLFGRRQVNRMQLNIHPDNAASRRIAEKCGFMLEGRMRGCWFHQGRFHDLEVWSLLREEHEAPS